MYITDTAEAYFLDVRPGKVKREARPDQLVTFTRRLREALAIKDRDLAPGARNQAGTLQLPGRIRDARPLHTQHFGEQVLGDGEGVIIGPVTHHEQPARQPLLEAVRPVARH